jgi:MFS family permease
VRAFLTLPIERFVRALQPMPSLTEADVRRTMRLSVFEGSFSMVFINWTQGSTLTGYALYMGATPFELGLIASVPLLGQVLSPIVAWLAGRVGRRKVLAILTAIIGRLLWSYAVILPFAVAPDSRAPVLIAMIAISSIFIAGNGSLWTAWMGDVVPQQERGRYFGFRAGVHGVVGMLANLAAGAFVDVVKAPISFQVVLSVAVMSGLVAASLLLTHAEPAATASRLRLRDTFAVPFQNTNFRRFLLFAAYWTFAVLLAAPFVIPYMLKYLRMTYTQIALWTVIASLSGLFLAPLWGRLADRVGNKPVLEITTIGAGSLLPLTWIMATPGNLWPIWFGGVVDALVWGAIGPAQFNLALSSAPRDNRASFIAVLSAVTGLAGFVGGLLSGVLLDSFARFTPTIRALGFEWTAYHSLILVSALLRLQAWRFLRVMDEPGAWRTRDVLNWRIWR